MTINTRAVYLTQILEKIGAPLMRSITGSLPIEGDPAIAAERMAELIARTIALSIKIGEEARLDTPENDEDAVRVALIALAAPLVAQHYQDFKKAPSDNDLQKIMNGLGAVLTFSENFTGMSETGSILQSLPEQEAKIKQIRYINGALPVVNAVAEFSFRQPEVRLVNDIISRLTARTDALLEDLSPENVNDSVDKRMIFSALSALYAECHMAETRRLKEEEAPEGATIDSVWKAFEMRAQMLEVVCGTALGTLPQGMVSVPSAFTPAPVAAAPSASLPSVPEKEASTNQDSQPFAQAQPQQQQPSSPPSAPSGGGNPMSMFAAKPSSVEPAQKIADDINALQEQGADDGDGAAPASVSAPVASPAAPENAEKPASGGGMGGGGPMSFFKSPPKTEEDDE